MGSNSDWPVLNRQKKLLKSFGVEVEVAVASAHRTPEMFMSLRQARVNAALR